VPVVPTLNESGMLIFELLIAAAGVLLYRPTQDPFKWLLSGSEMFCSNNNSLRIRAQVEGLQVHVERIVGPLTERRQGGDRRADKRASLPGRRETD